MRNNRRFETISGLGAALLGIIALTYALFGPLYQGTTSSGQSGTANMFQVGIQPITFIVFSIVFLALLGVIISTTIHSRTARKTWRFVLGGSAIVISAFTVLTLPSIGLFMLPSTILTLVAFLLSSFSKRERETGSSQQS